ncbi:hypothetical protein [Liquorilactobacillus satsumensis]|uniref:Uncharacterized protein n=1 Tax=Liquorilactobacillus satsumensis DSM 16230 = JCM 12392 TaxID=1423801 RepID=A0A0R1UWE6_9LACO|nr:hypothetical protein [Liquorilactobacillus satsumensis]KRL97446.1 hypothetical protein FD50_GL001427 [Liquorilactobacillus satsumensis DSM 16230 = JCM 12392]
MEEQHKSLVIWFRNGATAMFIDVKDFRELNEGIQFGYFGQSTQTQRKAKFLHAAIAGYAFEID